MPITIPAFDQYQSPMFPLRGLWNCAPTEGDKFVNAEIDWFVTTKTSAVQFSLSGNSPVSLSQIIALSVDNSRSGSDVDFIFPDSGFMLTVPAHNQVVAPVFTNALMFYASAPKATAGDVTILQILNSMPPPIPIAASNAQNAISAQIASLANATTPIIAAGINGTLNTVSMTVLVQTLTPATAVLQLIDGAGKAIWTQLIESTTSVQNLIYDLAGLSIRFTNGLNAVVSGSGLQGAWTVNAYYSTP